jgi:biopolymer transport protein TolR
MAMGPTANRGIVSDMNVTPMIDVLLVLIIVFMVINTAMTATGLDALIPKPPDQSVAIPQPERTVVVQVTDVGADRPLLKVNGEAVSWEGLRARLIDIYKLRAERVLFVKADGDIEFENIARVIDVAHGAYEDMKIGLLR